VWENELCVKQGDVLGKKHGGGVVEKTQNYGGGGRDRDTICMEGTIGVVDDTGKSKTGGNKKAVGITRIIVYWRHSTKGPEGGQQDLGVVKDRGDVGRQENTSQNR